MDPQTAPPQPSPKRRLVLEALAARNDRPATATGVPLTPLARTIAPDRLGYTHVSVDIDRARRTATLTVKAPVGPQPGDVAAIEAAVRG